MATCIIPDAWTFGSKDEALSGSSGAGSHPGRIDWSAAAALVRKPDEVRVMGLSLLC